MHNHALVFVDTSYLLASFYNSWDTGARSQLHIDLTQVVATLNQRISVDLGLTTFRQQWYDGVPESGPHRYQRSLKSINGVQFREGQLIEWGERRTQKAVDTLLVADLVRAAFLGRFTDVVLVSGDADMLPGVNEATCQGLKVHLYGFGAESMSASLRHACDSVFVVDPREDFEESMHIEPLEGPLPAVNPAADQFVDDDPLVEAEPEAEPTEFAQIEGDSHLTAPLAVADPVTNGVPAMVTSTASAARAERAVAAAPAPTAAGPGGDRDSEDQGTGDQDNGDLEQAGDGATAAATDSALAATGLHEEYLPAQPPPTPSMMRPKLKPQRSRYVPLPGEIWTDGENHTPFSIGEQYATWWFTKAANTTQKSEAHLLSGGELPPEIDRPLLQFACQTLHEYTLSNDHRIQLRTGFHSGIRGLVMR